VTFFRVGIALGCLFLVGCGQAEEATTLFSPEGAPQEEAPSVSAAAPDVEPGTELTEADFKQTLRDTGAKYVVLQVYMEACGSCMAEALQLTKQQPAWQALGVAILGMGMDETPAGPQTFDRHTGGRITYPLYLAPWFSEQQEVDATPTMFIYGADGEQLFRTDPETAREGVLIALHAKLSELLDQPLGP